MSLFKVKGWDVPSQAVTDGPSNRRSRKRKRSVYDAPDIQSAKVNVENLMRKVEEGSLKLEGKDQKTLRTERGVASAFSAEHRDDRKTVRQDKPQRKSRKEKDIKSHRPPKDTASKLPGIRGKPSSIDLQMTSDGVPSAKFKKGTAEVKSSVGLTSLQTSMKNSLHGARFRWINELLYNTGSVEGHKLMQDEPNLYDEYHTGFRQQVHSWPSNPVNHYITVLSTYPRGTVIADLGCGDAALARALIPKGYCVLSYDLVSDGAYVLEANICEKIPLPGSEATSADENPCQVVDVCVCALSLMSLDWIGCIRETWRVLKIGGELKIAEVTSRFTNLDQFITIVCDLGFKLKSKDDSNTHFILFEFRKVFRAPLSTKKWDNLRKQNTLLKPCEYKRR